MGRQLHGNQQLITVGHVPNSLLYSGKLWRESKFEVLLQFTKVFCAKFGGVASFGSTSEYSFLPVKFPTIRYIMDLRFSIDKPTKGFMDFM